MSETVKFETPENIVVHYELAGLGTRFTAWVYDMLLIVVIEIGLVVVGMLLALVLGGTGMVDIDALLMSPVLFISLIVIILGFLPIAYFMVFEHSKSGQTPGKRSVQLRVVSAQGFSLTFGAVFLRNVFRLIDTFPILWTVPFLTKRGQRFGDMVADTIVIQETLPNVHSVPMRLMQRKEVDATFAFTPAQLGRLKAEQFKAVESFLERRGGLGAEESARLTSRMANALADDMEYLPLPAADQHGVFLEDLLAAHLRRQMGGIA